jgi:hypothetical protein
MDRVKAAVIINSTPTIENIPDVPLTPNVSREADVAFMAELKRTDLSRYNWLMDAMQKQAYANQRKAA